MIDLRLLRDDPDRVRASQRRRGEDESLVDALLAADERRRAAIARADTLRAEQKSVSRSVAQAAPDERAAVLARAKELAEEVKLAEADQSAAEAGLREAHLAVPNVVEDGVPAGGEDDFVTLETVGTPPAVPAPREHTELGERLGAIDMSRGAKVSGARFYFLTGIGAQLELALVNLAMAQAADAGFTPVIAPALVRPEVMEGTGFLGQHSDEVYRLEKQDLYLVGTSEVPLAGYHMDEILDLTGGAKRYAGWSTCYRSEAGSYGKDTRGIIRVHQFNKLEMFVFTEPADAEAEHLRLVGMQERMLQDLGLTYRVIDVAAGDLGSSAARKYDIEAWVPTQQAYRELTSTSNCTTFQARRLDIRYRPDGGRTQHVATLNGTLATTRWIVALLETHQRADGSVTVPEVLRPYLGLDVLEPVA